MTERARPVVVVLVGSWFGWTVGVLGACWLRLVMGVVLLRLFGVKQTPHPLSSAY